MKREIIYPKYVCPKYIPNPQTEKEMKDQLGFRLISSEPFNKEILELIDPVIDASFASRSFVARTEKLLNYRPTVRANTHLREMAESVKNNRKFKYMKSYIGEELVLKAFKNATICTYQKGEQIHKITDKFDKYCIILEGSVILEMPFLQKKKFNSLFDYALFKTTNSNKIARETKLPMSLPKHEESVWQPKMGTTEAEVTKAKAELKRMSMNPNSLPRGNQTQKEGTRKTALIQPIISTKLNKLNLNKLESLTREEREGSKTTGAFRYLRQNTTQAYFPKRCKEGGYKDMGCMERNEQIGDFAAEVKQVGEFNGGCTWGTRNISPGTIGNRITDKTDKIRVSPIVNTEIKERRMGMTMLGLMGENSSAMKSNKSTQRQGNILSEEILEEDSTPSYNLGESIKDKSNIPTSTPTLSNNHSKYNKHKGKVTQMHINLESPATPSKEPSLMSGTPRSEYLSEISSQSEPDQDLPFSHIVSKFKPLEEENQDHDSKQEEIQNIYEENYGNNSSDDQISNKKNKKHTNHNHNHNTLPHMNIKFTILEDVFELKAGDGFGDFSYLGNSSAIASVKAKTVTKLIIISKFDFSPTMRFAFLDRINKMTSYLKDIPLFAKYQKSILIELASNIIYKTFELKHFVFKEGDKADGVYIIKDGEFEISKKVVISKGRNQGEFNLSHVKYPLTGVDLDLIPKVIQRKAQTMKFKLFVAGKNNIVGLEEAISGERRNLSVQCKSTTSTLYYISKEIFAQIHHPIGGFTGLERQLIERINFLNERVNAVVNIEGRMTTNLRESPTKFEEEDLPRGSIPSCEELMSIRERLNKMKDQEVLKNNKESLILFENLIPDGNRKSISSKEVEYKSLIEKIKSKKGGRISTRSTSPGIIMGVNNIDNKNKNKNISPRRSKEILPPESTQNHHHNNNYINRRRYNIITPEPHKYREWGIVEGADERTRSRSNRTFRGGGGNYMVCSSRCGPRKLYIKDSLPFLHQRDQGASTSSTSRKHTSQHDTRERVLGGLSVIQNTSLISPLNNVSSQSVRPSISQKDYSSIFITQKGLQKRENSMYEGNDIILARSCLPDNMNLSQTPFPGSTRNDVSQMIGNLPHNKSMEDIPKTTQFSFIANNYEHNRCNQSQIVGEKKLKEQRNIVRKENRDILNRVQSLGNIRLPKEYTNLRNPQLFNKLTFKNKYMENLITNVKYYKKRENRRLVKSKHNLFRQKVEGHYNSQPNLL